MVLYKESPLPDATDIRQVLTFAQRKCQQLRLLLNLCQEEVKQSLGMYHSFFRDMVEVIRGLPSREVAGSKLQVLLRRMPKMLQEAQVNQTMTRYPLLSHWHKKFCDQYKELADMMEVIRATLSQSFEEGTSRQNCGTGQVMADVYVGTEQKMAEDFVGTVSDKCAGIDMNGKPETDCSGNKLPATGNAFGVKSKASSNWLQAGTLANTISETTHLDGYLSDLDKYVHVDDEEGNEEVSVRSRQGKVEGKKPRMSGTNPIEEEILQEESTPPGEILRERCASTNLRGSKIKCGMSDEEIEECLQRLKVPGDAQSTPLGDMVFNAGGRYASPKAQNNMTEQKRKEHLQRWKDIETSSTGIEGVTSPQGGTGSQKLHAEVESTWFNKEREMRARLQQLKENKTTSTGTEGTTPPLGGTTFQRLPVEVESTRLPLSLETVVPQSDAGASASLERTGPVSSIPFTTARSSAAPMDASTEIKTLEDAIAYFGLQPRLEALEKSLRDVRQNRSTAGQHEALLKQLDKDLLQLSRMHHPDKARNGGRVQPQTALNATRKVLGMLTASFLEDIGIEHSYALYSGLDLGLLGNDEEMKSRVFEVLFKLSLASDIKQGKIVATIGKFLTEAQKCIAHYVVEDWNGFGNSSVHAGNHLKNCTREYRKLLAEYSEVAAECESNSGIRGSVHRMKRECSRHLRHLEELSKKLCDDRGSSTVAEPYASRLEMDEYFVLPLVRYTNVLLLCRAMVRHRGLKLGGWKWSSFLGCSDHHSPCAEPQTVDRNERTLYYLACVRAGDGRYKEVVRHMLRKGHVSSEEVEAQFLANLLEVHCELRERFGVGGECYRAKGTRQHVVKELKELREMMAELQREKGALVEGVGEIRRNNEAMGRRLDDLLEGSREAQRHYDACLADAEMFKREIRTLCA